MKVAIPTFGERVSPRFDCAAVFLVVTLEQTRVAQQQEIVASGWAPHERINRLVDMGVEVVLCGGIDRWSADSLASAGITLHDRISGSIQQNLEALLRGELVTEVRQVGRGRCDCERDRGRGSRRHCRRDDWGPPRS